MRQVRERLGLEGIRTRRDAFPLMVLFGLNAVDELDQATFAVLSPNIRDAFHLSNAGITAFSALLIPVVIGIGLPLGFLADRLRRTRIAAVGASAWGVFSLLTGLAPTLWVLGLARVGSGLGRAVNAPTHESLLADYYPPETRAGAYGVHKLANPVGLFLGPLLGGVIAHFLGWRAPFILLSIPTFVLVGLALRLQEPIRGVHERRARGVSEELAKVEEEPPSWEESWRTVNGVRTVRRIYRSAPFLVSGLLGIAILRNLFLESVFGVNEVARGSIDAASQVFAVVGLLVGIPLANRFIRTNPARVFRLIAAAAAVVGGGFVGFALAPNLPLAIGFAFLSAMAGAIVVPGLVSVVSLVTPPRARSFGFGLFYVYALPGLVALPVVGALGDAYGMRVGILAMVPIFLLGAYILASAGGGVAADVKANQMAALASAAFRLARDRGETKLLVCRGVDVHYGHVQVLFGVDLDVADGEIVAILGTNGAGKSTLLKGIAGLVDPSGGAIGFDAADITHAGAQETLRRGIVYMPGGQGVFPGLTVEENLRVAGWVMRRRPEELGTATQKALSRFPALEKHLAQPAGNLSGGEQQMLALAMVFIARPRMLMIDELSLGLAPAVVADLLEAVKAIHAQGTTVVLVEQSVNVALSIAKRTVFLEKGEVRFDGPTSDLLQRSGILRSVFLEGAAKALGSTRLGVDQHEKPGRDGISVRFQLSGAVERWDGQPPRLLVVDQATKRFGGITAVDGVSLELRRGEIVGVIGPNGAGKTTLFDLITGFLPLDEGKVEFCGKEIGAAGAHARARLGLGRSFQDARLFPSMTVREVIAVSLDRHLLVRDLWSPLVGLPDQRVEERVVQTRVGELIDLMGLGAFADKFVSELSTGTRRIVDIACALAHNPIALLLDEPSSGIAQRETEALAPLLEGIVARTGTSLFVIEHDMPLINAISDRLIALDLGRVVATGSPEEVMSAPAVVRSYLGSDTPAVVRPKATKRARVRAKP